MWSDRRLVTACVVSGLPISTPRTAKIPSLRTNPLLASRTLHCDSFLNCPQHMSITAKPTQTRRFVTSDGIRTHGIPTTKCRQLGLSYNGCRRICSAGRAWYPEHRREKFSQAGWGRACVSGCARVEGTAWRRLCAPLRISIFSSVVLVLIIVLIAPAAIWGRLRQLRHR